MSRDYKDLKIWQKADSLARKIYRLTRSFPQEEQFNLTSQISRASLSIPTNIVEGFYRGRKEFLHFLVMAMASLKETEYLLSIAMDRKYINQVDGSELLSTMDELSRMLAVFMKSLTSSPANPLTS